MTIACQVLRRNKDSLMAVLEAFVYDPLLNWRLIDNKPKSKKSKTHGEVCECDMWCVNCR